MNEPEAKKLLDKTGRLQNTSDHKCKNKIQIFVLYSYNKYIRRFVL